MGTHCTSVLSKIKYGANLVTVACSPLVSETVSESERGLERDIVWFCVFIYSIHISV